MRKFAWSYSALTSFETCPWRYYLTRVTKEVQEPETEVLRWGNQVHQAFEDYVKSGGEVNPPYDWFQKWKPVADKILTKDGDIYAEYEAAITEDFEPCGWWDKEAWCRGKFDVVVVNGDEALVLDYKTGKRRPDSDQLKLFALLAFIHFPEVQKVKTSFVWLKAGGTDSAEYTRDQASELWPEFIHRVQRMQHALKTMSLKKNQSGLCRNWCPVPKNKCEFSGKEK